VRQIDCRKGKPGFRVVDGKIGDADPAPVSDPSNPVFRMNLIRVFGFLSARICLVRQGGVLRGTELVGRTTLTKEEVKEELKILVAMIALAIFGALFVIGLSIERQSERAGFCLTHYHGEQIHGG
jgi:hypothetical protein